MWEDVFQAPMFFPRSETQRSSERRGPRRLLRAGSLALIVFALACRTGPAQAGSPQPAAVGSQKLEALDLNTASASELGALPGMGAVYVKRILEGRPYSAKNQLVTRGVLPRAAYDRIRDLVVAHRPPRN